MSCELITIGKQTVQPGQDIIFSAETVPCTSGLVQFNKGSGAVQLSVYTQAGGCPCRNNVAKYLVDFGANIAISEGGTVGEISVGIVVGGSVVPATIMRVTPAAVEQFWNVSRAKVVDVFRNCCQSFAIRNLSDQPIDVQEGNVYLDRV